MSTKYLAKAVTATGGQTPLTAGKDIHAQDFTIAAWGTWGSGGSVTIQVSFDGGTTWISTGVTFTANGIQNLFGRYQGAQFRANITAGTGFNLNVVIQ